MMIIQPGFDSFQSIPFLVRKLTTADLILPRPSLLWNPYPVMTVSVCTAYTRWETAIEGEASTLVWPQARADYGDLW